MIIRMIVGRKVGLFVGWLSIKVSDLTLNDGSSRNDAIFGLFDLLFCLMELCLRIGALL